MQEILQYTYIKSQKPQCTILITFTFNPLISAFIHAVCLWPNQIFICSLRTQNTSLCVARISETLAAHGKECNMDMSSIQAMQQSAAASETCLCRKHSWDQCVSKFMGKNMKTSDLGRLNKAVCTVRHPEVRLLRELLCALCVFITRSCSGQFTSPSGGSGLLHTNGALQFRRIKCNSIIRWIAKELVCTTTIYILTGMWNFSRETRAR